MSFHIEYIYIYIEQLFDNFLTFMTLSIIDKSIIN